MIGLRSLLVGMSFALSAPALGQAPAPTPHPALPPGVPAPTPSAPPAQQYDDPYKAYDAGAFDQALQGFLDYRVERPNDPNLLLNIGNTHYQMNNFEEATRVFEQAALEGKKELRAEALYNLGNTHYRAGKLEDALKTYERVLDTNPDDPDAKFNIEFVRDEIRRRHEEQKDRQNQQEQQGQNQQQSGDQQQQNQEQSNDQQQEQQEQQEQSGEQQPSDGEQQDSDKDGLSDELEKSAQNPTDPNNPDTDGDGVPDGQEDKNQNGKVDKEETDPTQKDTDKDGTPDSAEPQHAAGQQGGGSKDGQKNERKLSPEEAQRYLQSLEDDKPVNPKRARKGGRRRVEKDW